MSSGYFIPEHNVVALSSKRLKLSQSYKSLENNYLA